MRPVRALIPMAADGVGPSQTCIMLANGMAEAGSDIEVMVNRQRSKPGLARVLAMAPGPLRHVPYNWIAGPASRAVEAWYLKRLADGDVAWLWPAASLRTHEIIARRGNPIVLEGINSRMGHAKPILDAAYDAFGAPPSHGITDARISEENDKIALARTIFAPSAAVEEGLLGTPLQDRFLKSSYGVDTLQPRRPRQRPVPADSDPVIYMFCGYACVRKGIHHLLDLWPRMPANAVLQIVGRIEPIIAERYRDLLASDSVQTVGFTRDVAAHYAEADVFVFPSLEEGDPLVAYEAAFHGLPAVSSAVGAGRGGAERGMARIVDPADVEAFLAALLELHTDPDLRQAEGARAAQAVKHYDWRNVGADRLSALERFLADGPT